MHKDKFGLAGAWGLLAAFFFLCGQPWFQGLAKTWIISNVGAKLTALGKQMDDVQATTAKMQIELSDHQNQIDKHQKEIEDAQLKLRSTQTNITEQQKSLTLAQNNIEAQQKQISDVEFLVNNLFGKMTYETFSGEDSNRVMVLPLEGDNKILFLKLKAAPLKYSVQCMGEGLITGQHSLSPMLQEANIAYSYISGDANLRGITYHVQYVRDTRVTNLVQKVEFKGTDTFFDDKRFTPAPDTGP